MTVQILEVCKVTPSPGSANICLPLSFFDLIWLRYQPVEILFFYEDPSHPQTFFLSILPKLKQSLSQTLQHFLPIAGNLIWTPLSPNPVIRYEKGDGVLLTTAQSDADFIHFSSSNFRETNIFQPLIADINESDSLAPLIAIKATVFPNQGFCIGITVHHGAFDGVSFINFMKIWSSLCKLGDSGNLNPELEPMFDRKSVRECYHRLEKLYIDALLKQNSANPRSLSIQKLESPPESVRGTFHLSGSDVKRLEEFVRARFGNQKHKGINCDLHISKFTITYAYLIVCLVKAKELTENVPFSIVVDCRARLEPPISANYFGNCLNFVTGDVEGEKLTKDDGIAAAVYAVGRTIKSLGDGVLKGAEKWLPRSFEEGEEREPTKIYLAGAITLKYYDIDFGWGRPRKVDISSIDKTRAISLMEGRDGDGGVELEICLSKDEMEKFASAFVQELAKIKPVKASL